MKLEIELDYLTNSLNYMKTAVKPGTSVPLETGLYLSAPTNKKVFTQCFSSTAKAQTCLYPNEFSNLNIKEYGDVLVNFDHLLSVLKVMEEGIITLETKDGYLMISDSKGVSYIKLLQTKTWSVFNITAPASMIQMSGEVFKRKCKSVIYAASDSDKRPALNGIHIIQKGSDYILEATDSYRIARNILTLKSSPDDQEGDYIIPSDISQNQPVKTDTAPNELIIPKKTVLQMISTLNDQDIVTLGFSKNTGIFVFNSNRTLMEFKSHTDKFPDIDKIIPNSTSCPYTLKMKLSELTKAIQRCSIPCKFDQKPSTIPTTLDIQDRSIKIYSDTPTLSQTQKIDFEDSNIDTLKLSFSNMYMMEMANSFPQDSTLVLFFQQGLKPVKIMSDDDSEQQISILAPIRPSK